jgi:hypothetical protein
MKLYCKNCYRKEWAILISNLGTPEQHADYKYKCSIVKNEAWKLSRYIHGLSKKKPNFLKKKKTFIDKLTT